MMKAPAVAKAQGQHHAFFQALASDSWDSFLQLVSSEGAYKDKASLQELVQLLPKKERYSLCAGLNHQVDVAVARLSDALEADEDPNLQELQLERACQSLQAVAHAAAVVLSHNPKAPPEPLQACAAKLHDHALLEATAQLCLAWWAASAPGRELLVPQTLPYLLVKALSTGKAVDVKRCHAMRLALQLLDFEDPSIADVRALLVRASFHPGFLRAAEGRRFLSFLFTLQAQLVQELGQVIRNQIPCLRRSILDAYGEILHRAWREASGSCQLAAEQLVQELAQAAIVASTPTMAAALRRVLMGFHKNKAAAAVDALLMRLYQPILFRAFSAANAAVRLNALALLVDAFPLQDPEAANKETDELLAKQFSTIGSCLGDGAPAVRAEAVRGLCHLLDLFWEVIPAATSAAFLKRLTGELLLDGASAAVRCAVLDGLGVLSRNPLSHALLKAVLPQVACALHDAALKVRVAFAELLLAIGATSGLHFLEVASVEALLAALADDSPQVGEKLQRLLQPSFYPGPEQGPALVAALLRQAPEAGRSFCAAAAGCLGSFSGPRLPLEELHSLAADLRDHLLASAPSASAPASGGAATPAPAAKRSRAGKRRGRNAQEPQEAAPAAVPEETPESWEAILGGLQQLSQGLAAASQYPGAEAQPLFEGAQLVQLYEAAPSSTSCCTALRMAAAAAHEVAARQLCDRLLPDLLHAAAKTGEQRQELAEKLRCLCAHADSRQQLLGKLTAALAGEKAGVAAEVTMMLLAASDTRTSLGPADLRQELLPALQEAARDAFQQLSATKFAEVPAATPAAILACAKCGLHSHLANRLDEAAMAADARERLDEPQAAMDIHVVQEACEWGRQLLEATPVSSIYPALTAEAGVAAEDGADVESVGAVLAVAAGLLAVASEAAALLKWTAASATHQAACVLADRLLQAVLQAKASHAEDAESGVASQAVLEIALLCADLLAAAGGCTEAAVGLPADVEAHAAAARLAGTVLQSLAQEPGVLPAAKAVLPRLLSTLCATSQPDDSSCRWLEPLLDLAVASGTCLHIDMSASKENEPGNSNAVGQAAAGSRKKLKAAAGCWPTPTASLPAETTRQDTYHQAKFLGAVTAAAASAKVQHVVAALALSGAWQAMQAGDVPRSCASIQFAAQMGLTGRQTTDAWHVYAESHCACLTASLAAAANNWHEAEQAPARELLLAASRHLQTITGSAWRSTTFA